MSEAHPPPTLPGNVHHVSTRVGSLAVEETGCGPPVLLWPSLFTDRSLWRHQRAALEERYRLLLVDPPGHGDSGPARGDYTLDDCATAAVEVLDAFDIRRATWVGLSWGGMTAMRAAVTRPKRVRALALFDTSADPERRLQRGADRVMAAIYRRFGLTGFLARAIRPLLIGKTTKAERPEVAEEVFAHVRRLERESVLAAVNAVVGRGTFLADVRRIACPTLVAVGEEDRATPPQFARRLADAIPGAQFHVIPRCGHLSSLEAPEEVTRLLGPFLDAAHEGIPVDDTLDETLAPGRRREAARTSPDPSDPARTGPPPTDPPPTGS